MDLLRPDSLLADESWLATLRVLEPHQMLVLVLAKDTNDAYADWSRFQAMGPPSEGQRASEEQERSATTGSSSRSSPTSPSCRPTP